MSDLRANLRSWLERVREGEELVVTNRGTPVPRMIGTSADLIERLERESVIGPPLSPVNGLRGRPAPSGTG